MRRRKEFSLTGEGLLFDDRPDAFGAFRVRADLGANRFGPVYLGRDPSTNTRVVIRTFARKEIWSEFADQDELIESLRKLCATKLEHPNVARPLTSGVQSDIPYVVYTYLPGTPMDVVIRQEGARPVADIRRRVADLAAAVDFAAGAGALHGMMAPCDVIFDGEATRVTGHGLAQALLRAGIPVEAEPPYASAQRSAGGPPTHSDDVYSLAAIALELLIGKPADPSNDGGRVQRETLGLPERRRVPRPAPHETRIFTTIAGVDAGLLRACFASAFSDEPGERPSTAVEFVSSFHAALADKRGEDVSLDDASLAVIFANEEKDVKNAASPGPVLHTSRAASKTEKSSKAFRHELSEQRIHMAELRQPDHSVLDSLEPEMRPSREPEIRFAHPEPIARDLKPVEIRRPVLASFGEGTHVPPAASGGRAFAIVVALILGVAAGFAAGFLVGTRPEIGAWIAQVTGRGRTTTVEETRPEPSPAQPESQSASSTAPDARSAVPSTEVRVPDPPIVPIPEPATPSPAQASPNAAAPALGSSERTPPPAPLSGRLLVRSTPAGASVSVDGQSRGVTPLALPELTFGDHMVEVTYAGHEARQQRITLSAARPSRSLELELRPTGAAQVTATSNVPGSVQIDSRPTGAQVFVDERLVGTTPLLMSSVAPGPHRIRLEMPGYKSWTTSVQVEPKTRFRLAASLEP